MCSIKHCNEPVRANGLCERHRQRDSYRARRLAQGLRDPAAPVECEVCGTEFVRDSVTVYCGDVCREIGQRARGHQRLYGISRREYFAMLRHQNWLCGICNKPESSPTKTLLSVDHDHITGLVRGLLCHRCNLGLGYFKDNPELLVRACVYLGAVPTEQALAYYQRSA